MEVLTCMALPGSAMLQMLEKLSSIQNDAEMMDVVEEVTSYADRLSSAP